MFLNILVTIYVLCITLTDLSAIVDIWLFVEQVLVDKQLMEVYGRVFFGILVEINVYQQVFHGVVLIEECFDSSTNIADRMCLSVRWFFLIKIISFDEINKQQSSIYFQKPI